VKNFSALVIIILLFNSCTSDKVENVPKQLSGEWEMIHYSSLLVASIDADEIIWTFNLSENQLIISNSIETKYPFILPSGNYTIEVLKDKIIIESAEYDYSIEDNQLTISNKPEVDGPLMIFNRN
jgi:hypothetical protein